MDGALAGLVILVIGDSHMSDPAYLVKTLHNRLLANGAAVSSYGQCGVNAEDWVSKVTAPCRAERRGDNVHAFDRSVAPTWMLRELVAANRPNLVIVELGDSMAGYDQSELPKAEIQAQVKALVGTLAAQNISCVWVGPTWGDPASPYRKTVARVKEMSDFLSQTVAPCGFIDSTKFAQPGEWPTVDGQHFTASGYRKWGSGIADAVVAMRSQPQIAIARHDPATEQDTH